MILFDITSGGGVILGTLVIMDLYFRAWKYRHRGCFSGVVVSSAPVVSCVVDGRPLTFVENI